MIIYKNSEVYRAYVYKWYNNYTNNIFKGERIMSLCAINFCDNDKMLVPRVQGNIFVCTFELRYSRWRSFHYFNVINCFKPIFMWVIGSGKYHSNYRYILFNVIRTDLEEMSKTTSTVSCKVDKWLVVAKTKNGRWLGSIGSWSTP